MADSLEQIRKVTEELVEAYTLRVATVVMIITEAYEMMDHLKETREALRQELQETLALNSSFRRRDFGGLMQGMIEPQRAREKGLKELLHQFQLSQQERTARLKAGLKTSDLQLVRRLRDGMQEEVDHVRSTLAMFQEEQGSFIHGLKSLLARGSKLTLKEFKEAMEVFRQQASNAPREGEVGNVNI